jgi:hypothetical protein
MKVGHATMADSRTKGYEFDSPYIDAPVWPWSVAGWSLAALLVALFVLAGLRA